MCVLQIHSLLLRWKKGRLLSGIQWHSSTSSPVCLRYITVDSLCSPTYSAQATRLRHAINHSTCSTPSPFRCSDYMTTPIIYCYIFRPPGKWFWTILHATSSLPARWTPLLERKPDSKESGIESLRIRWAHCALPTIICPQLHILSSWILDALILSHIKYSLYDHHLIEWKYWPRQTSRRWWEMETPTRLTQNCCQIGKRLFSKSYLSILLARRSYSSTNNYHKFQHSGT